jgi:phosphatidate phosphatase PAH1
MKIRLVILATIALVLNLITISPAKAEIGITSATISKPTMAKIGCVQKLCQAFRVEEMAPIFINVGNNITSHIFFRQDLGDRLFNLNQKSGVACLLDGQGSKDGSVTCGVLDMF